MNMSSPLLASITPDHSYTSAAEPINQTSSEHHSVDTKAELRMHFMHMMEAHDRVRARLLGSSHAESYVMSATNHS